jgi:hypothetical protein
MINGGIKLFSIDGICNAFLAMRMYVFIENGQSYAIAASTIGTLCTCPASGEKAFTSACLPEYDII